MGELISDLVRDLEVSAGTCVCVCGRTSSLLVCTHDQISLRDIDPGSRWLVSWMHWCILGCGGRRYGSRGQQLGFCPVWEPRPLFSAAMLTLSPAQM